MDKLFEEKTKSLETEEKLKSLEPLAKILEIKENNKKLKLKIMLKKVKNITFVLLVIASIVLAGSVYGLQKKINKLNNEMIEATE